MRNERLERAMADAGLTKHQLARKIDANPKTIERWINQGRTPWLIRQRAAAEVLGVTPTDLWPGPERRQRPELVEMFSDRASVPRDTWLGLFDRVEHVFEMLVYAGLFFHEQHPRLIPLLGAKADKGVRVRLLFGDPDDEVVARRGAEEDIGDAVQAKVRNSIAQYRPLAGYEGVEVRLHATTLYTSTYRFDEDMLVNPHIYGLPGAHSPVLHLRQSPGGRLFANYAECFERVWAGAVPAWESS